MVVGPAGLGRASTARARARARGRAPAPAARSRRAAAAPPRPALAPARTPAAPTTRGAVPVPAPSPETGDYYTFFFFLSIHPEISYSREEDSFSMWRIDYTVIRFIFSRFRLKTLYVFFKC